MIVLQGPPPMGLLGIFWEPSGSLLRASGGLLGAFLGTFVVGAFWEPLILVGSFREPSGSLLGALRAFGGLLGTFWERLEPSESCGQCLQRQQQLENKSQNLQGAPRLHTKISGRATKMGNPVRFSRKLHAGATKKERKVAIFARRFTKKRQKVLKNAGFSPIRLGRAAATKEKHAKKRGF